MQSALTGSIVTEVRYANPVYVLQEHFPVMMPTTALMNAMKF
jgi:hypothetical protein